MTGLAVMLANLPPWLWPVLGLLVGVAAARLWPRADQARLPALWAALGRTPPAGRPADAWSAALAEVARQREAMLAAQAGQLQQHLDGSRIRLLETVLASLQDGVLVLDPSEQVLLANAMARRILGLGDRSEPALDQAAARHEVLDGIRAVLGADLAPAVKTRRIDWQRDDQRFVYLIRALAPPDGATAPGTHIVLLEDLTAEEREARAKSEFIYGVSHELKTPLTAIQASLEIADEDQGLTAEERNQLIRMSYQEAMRLSQMVAELLDLARVEAGITEFKREQVAMDELFAGLLELHQPIAARKSVTLQWDISDYVADLMGDTRLLRQAFVNIIGNAIKYTKAGGQVGVTGRLEGTELVVRVRDTGIGIAPEDLPRVFEKFFRAGNAEQAKVQGTGLGLPMARYIVERHHGRIEVQSKVGVGTEFAVFLPTTNHDPYGENSGSTLMSVDAATR